MMIIIIIYKVKKRVTIVCIIKKKTNIYLNKLRFTFEKQLIKQIFVYL